MERQSYKPLSMRKASDDLSYRGPVATIPGPVRSDSPAVAVMTDLSRVPAATVGIDATAHQATQAMISRGVRMLLVMDGEERMLGLITAWDTMGEKPIQRIREHGGRHADLTVADLMTPLSQVDVIDLDTVLHAEVGHVLATLREAGRQHALVVVKDKQTGLDQVRGIFSATQIARQLGIALPSFNAARTFAEIEEALAH